MIELQNTLYVTTPLAYVHLDQDTVRVEVDHATKARLPLIHIAGIVCFGDVLVSPSLLHRCSDDGRFVVWLDRNGRYKARMEGRTGGNVLLRRAQHLALSSPTRPLIVAAAMVAAKVQNVRDLVLRGAREATDAEDEARLRRAAESLAGALVRMRYAFSLDELRGIEGDAARAYFASFDSLVKVDRSVFSLDGRSRRPPRNPMNAVLSFLYTLLRTDCEAALQGVGLDPQVGFFHALRPGRPSLALDLMEEFRAPFAERLALTLVNRRQLTAESFEERYGGAVYLNADGRKTVITAYQERKREEVLHAGLDRKLPLGLVPHVQARLLARWLRGDTDVYLPYVNH